MIWSRPELKVLFVCTANVCRSPLAEGLLRHRLRAVGLAHRVQVRSAGTAAIRGLRPDPRVEEVAAEAGVPLGRIRSRRLTPKMLSSSDYVLVMDRGHLEEIMGLRADSLDEKGGWPGHAAGTLELLGHFLPGGEVGADTPDIPDPYFGDLQGFREVHATIDSAVGGFLEHIGSRLLRDF